MTKNNSLSLCFYDYLIVSATLKFWFSVFGFGVLILGLVLGFRFLVFGFWFRVLVVGFVLVLVLGFSLMVSPVCVCVYVCVWASVHMCVHGLYIGEVSKKY